MKNTLIKGCLFLSTSLLVLSGCSSGTQAKTEKVESATTELNKANKELQDARVDSVNAHRKYKVELEIKLRENDQKIAELKNKLKEENKDLRANYQKQVDALDKKNSDLKDRVAQYQEESAEKWETFKMEFNQEMDDLGKSISKTAQKNMK
ncbi:MAG: hypothetical protein PSX36_04605 [bacterium]|nr:hypothetical protein [bacterium]